MHIDRKIQLGELYKELRIARGLKQKDVARKGLSIAQLSKFSLSSIRRKVSLSFPFKQTLEILSTKVSLADFF